MESPNIIKKVTLLFLIKRWEYRKNVQNKQVKDHDPSNHWSRASFKAYCPGFRVKSRQGQYFLVCPVKNTIFLKKGGFHFHWQTLLKFGRFRVCWLKVASFQPRVKASAALSLPPTLRLCVMYVTENTDNSQLQPGWRTGWGQTQAY